MSDSYYNQGSSSNNYPAQGRHGSTASYAPYSSMEQGYYPPPPQNNYGTYRPPEEEGYRGSPRHSNMQVGPAYEGSYYDDDESRSRHHHHRRDYDDDDDDYDDRARSHSRRRSRSRNGSSASGRERGAAIKKPSHQTEKKLAATVAGGAIGALAVHELSGGHHDIATVVGGLVGAYAGNKLEKKHEAKKEEKYRRQSESQGSFYSGSGRDLVRDESGERRGSRDSRRRSSEYYDDSDSESDSSRRRRRHNH